MDASPPRRHFKSIFPNHSGYPGLSAALEISAVFRHFDAFRRQFVCTLKEDEVLYDRLQLQMNEFYSNELACNVASRVRRNGVYAALLNGSWKRVRVDRIDFEIRHCAVEAIDDGQLLTLSVGELFVLDPAFITNQYKRTFGVRFALPRKPKRNCLAAAGFVDGHELQNGQFVNVFIFSDREPFLALLTEAFVRIQAEKLVDDLDMGSARLWALTLSGGPGRCRGVAFGSYTMACLPCDVWCDVTVAAFESLEDVQVRGPEQSIRLLYLEQFMESVYCDEEIRDRLAFETGVHVSEGLACVVWDASNHRWVRARITCTSGDRSVVDAAAVDYPSITLRGLRFRDGEVYMLRTDLLFPPLVDLNRTKSANNREQYVYVRNVSELNSTIIRREKTQKINRSASPEDTILVIRQPDLNNSMQLESTFLQHCVCLYKCCSIRAIDAGDKLETFTKSAVAKEVLQVGVHIRVYSPASSTLSIIELSNGLKLGEYIEHAVEVDSVRRSGLGQNYPDSLEDVDTGLARLYAAVPGRGSHAEVTAFSSSMSSFPRTVLVPHERHVEPFSQSLSLGSQRRSLPSRCGVSAFHSSKHRCSISNHFTSLPPPSPILPAPSSSSSNSSQYKTPKMFSRPTIEAQRTPFKENPFRKPLPLYKKQRKSSTASSSSTNFENDYLNKSISSCESDSENETFGRSVRQKSKGSSSIVVALPSPPLLNSDSYSENSDLLRREKPVPVEVMSINCATEIYLSTTETSMRYEKLKKELSVLNDADLLRVSGTWCIQGEHYLFWLSDGCCWVRVKIVAREEDEWKVLCVDTGEEKFVRYNSRFYRLPASLTIDEYPPTCLGPLRLRGPMDSRWLGIAARVCLRGLCEKARHLTASFGKDEGDRSVILYDEKRRCLNDQFLEFIEKQPF